MRDKAIAQGTFMIKHYAGDVTYTAEGFLAKNADSLFKDLSRLTFQSSCTILKQLFPEGNDKTWAGAQSREIIAAGIILLCSTIYAIVSPPSACFVPSPTPSSHHHQRTSSHHPSPHCTTPFTSRVHVAPPSVLFAPPNTLILSHH